MRKLWEVFLRNTQKQQVILLKTMQERLSLQADKGGNVMTNIPRHDIQQAKPGAYIEISLADPPAGIIEKETGKRRKLRVTSKGGVRLE